MLEKINYLQNEVDILQDYIEERREELYPGVWDVSDTLYEVATTAVDSVMDDLIDEVDDLKERLNDLENIAEDVIDDDLDDILSDINALRDRVDDIEYSEELTDALHEEMDRAFIYYSDAWDYLQERGITDFEDAFKNGCTNICSIAYYYLSEEYYSI